jgi:hypothetical protein
LALVILCACSFAAVVAMYQFSDRMVIDAKSVLEIVNSFFIVVYFMTYSYDFARVEMLFDVRKLTQQQVDRKTKESDETPLLAKLDGDIL